MNTSDVPGPPLFRAFYYLDHLLYGPHSLIGRDVKRLTGGPKADEDPHGQDILPPSAWLLCGVWLARGVCAVSL